VNSLFSLKEKNILITGASSGIGKQCALLFSQLGANVILIARNKERLKITYNEMEKGNHLFFSQDITEYDKLEELIRNSVEKIGKISGFVHSAGIETTLPLRSMEPSFYEKMFSINVISGFELARIISKKKYLDNKGSSFIFISSVMGVVGNSALIGYSATKGALISATKSFALELISKNVRVNSISPGYVKTEMANKLFDKIPKEAREQIINMHPLGLGTPEYIANACVFLLSDASRWITGTNLIVDGGYSAR
jgi:NAD(P)-dependent dehydrogenase (short-subunit alcohol dehydrogenase family)